MDKKPVKPERFVLEPGKEKESTGKTQITKQSYFNQRSGSQGKEHYLDIDDEPISSYVPQTLTYQHRAHEFKGMTPLYVPMKSKHRSAEEGKLDFTGKKNTSEYRAHSARDKKEISKNLGQYLGYKGGINFDSSAQVSLFFTIILS